jgi:uncharacterized OsmC-like protein
VRHTEFTWTTRVTAESRARAAVHARRHRFTVGAPVEFDPQADAVSALEYLLGALGADLVNGLQAIAARRRLRLDALEATVEGRLDNPLVYLAVVGEEGHPGLVAARVKVYASSPDPEARVREAWAETLDRSPIARTLRGCVDLSLELHLVA